MESDNLDVLGLRRRMVMLHNSTPRWAELYEEEAARLSRALGGLALDIQHVGSTAVPGLKAKPILDIAVGVRRLEDAVQCRAPLESLGYEYTPAAGVPDDAVFGKGKARTHLVHVVEHGGPVWSGFVRFRDTLRADAVLARAYESLPVRSADRR